MDVFKLKATLGLDSSAYEAGLDKAKSMASSVGSGIGNAIGTGIKAAGAAIGAATAAVTGFAAASVNVGMDFDSSMSQVAATMGVATNEIGELRDFAQEMGRTTAFSATQAADALNYMALAGYDADQSMAMLPNVLNLAAAGNMDLARASDMVTDAQTALGLSFGETNDLVDMMAKTASKTNTSVEQLGDAILTIGGTAQNLAGGTNELNTMLGVLADNGIKGAEAGTHLRNAVLSLSAPTDKAAQTLNQLGITTKDAYGNLLPLPEIMGQLDESLDGLGTAEKAEIINTIFNKTDLAAIQAMLGTTAERYDEVSLAIEGAWYSEQSFDKQMKSISVDMDEVKPKFEQMGISADEFDRALATSHGNAKNFTESLAMFADEGTTTDDILKTMGTDIRVLDHAFQGITGSAQQMAETQLDNLAGDVTMFKSALEGAQLLISGELSGSLREFVQFGTDGLQRISEAFEEGGLEGAMDAFKEVLSDGIGMVTEKIPDFIAAGIELLGALGQGIMDNAGTIWDAMVNIGGQVAEAALGLAQNIAEGLEEADWAEIAQNIVDFLSEALSGDTAEGFLETGINIATSLMNGLFEAAPVFLQGMTEALQNITQAVNDFDWAGTAQSIIDNLVNYLSSDSMTGFIGAGLDLVSGLINGMLQAAPVLVDGALQLIELLASDLASNTTSLLETAITLITDLATYLAENVGNIADVAIDIIMALVEGIIGALPTLIENLPIIIESIIETLHTLITKLPELGVQIIAELITGIVETIPELIAHFPEIIQAIIDVFTTFNPISLGSDIINGIIEGVSDVAPELISRMEQAGADALDALMEQEWFQQGVKVITDIADGIISVKDMIMTKVTEIVDAISEFWKDTDWLSLGTKVVEGIWDGISGGLSWIKERIEGWVGDVFSFLKRLFKIESPSKLMRDVIGVNIVKGIAEGIEEGTPEVEASLENIRNLAVNPLDIDETVSIGNAPGSGFLSSSIRESDIDSLADAIVNAFIRANITVEYDDREFGRLVRKLGAPT